MMADFVPEIRHTIRQAVARRAWQWSVSRRPGCFVLMYHRIGQAGDPFPHLSVARFRQQMEWVGTHCTVIAPDAFQSAARAPAASRPPVLLTFDDGTRDYHDLAYPVLKQLGLPAVVFLMTDYVDHPRLPWWDRLHHVVRHARVDRVSLPWRPERTLSLHRSNHARVVAECEQYFKNVPDDLKEQMLDELVLALGDPACPAVNRQTMTWDEVRATMDLTTYGAHTHTHPLLSQVGLERVESEIRLSRDRIAAETGVTPTLFAYPNGDVTPLAKTLLRRYGFELAFSTREGLNDANTDWLEVRRTAIATLTPNLRMSVQAWR